MSAIWLMCVVQDFSHASDLVAVFPFGSVQSYVFWQMILLMMIVGTDAFDDLERHRIAYRRNRESQDAAGIIYTEGKGALMEPMIAFDREQ